MYISRKKKKKIDVSEVGEIQSENCSTHPYGDEHIVLFELVQVGDANTVSMEGGQLHLTVNKEERALMVAEHQLATTTRTRRDIDVLKGMVIYSQVLALALWG